MKKILLIMTLLLGLFGSIQPSWAAKIGSCFTKEAFKKGFKWGTAALGSGFLFCCGNEAANRYLGAQVPSEALQGQMNVQEQMNGVQEQMNGVQEQINGVQKQMGEMNKNICALLPQALEASWYNDSKTWTGTIIGSILATYSFVRWASSEISFLGMMLGNIKALQESRNSSDEEQTAKTQKQQQQNYPLKQQQQNYPLKELPQAPRRVSRAQALTMAAARQ